jgi:hypothetical protein
MLWLSNAIPDPDCGVSRMRVASGLVAVRRIFFSVKRDASLDDNFHGIKALNSQQSYSKKSLTMIIPIRRTNCLLSEVYWL